VDGELGEQDLDRDLAVEEEILREEDVGHAAAPNALVDLVPVVDDRGVAAATHRFTCPSPNERARRRGTRLSTHPRIPPSWVSRRREPRTKRSDPEPVLMVSARWSGSGWASGRREGRRRTSRRASPWRSGRRAGHPCP